MQAKADRQDAIRKLRATGRGRNVTGQLGACNAVMQPRRQTKFAVPAHHWCRRREILDLARNSSR